ncbi:MAG: NFYB/HAP3 family transcription factor subunit [Sulfurovaceae bacterium]|nr:NFYB/HAP3 family transcription factor subunit [Sulfurovaceae bacterium]
MKKAGADRISDGAKEELRKVIEENIKQIATKATKLANHAGRKTIKVEDIKLAYKQ